MNRQRYVTLGCEHTGSVTIVDVDDGVVVCQLHARCCEPHSTPLLLKRAAEMRDMLNREQQVREVLAAPATDEDRVERLQQQVLDLEDQLAQAKTRAECAEKELRDILDCPANAPAAQAPTPPEVPAVPVAESFPADDIGPLF